MEKELIRQQITFLEKKILELQNEKQKLETELNKLNQKAAILPHPASLLKPTSSFTPDEKIKIFKQLFRGWDDVYARLWTSNKTGRKGYSPVCKNEWVTNVCRKYALKFLDCPNREYLHLDAQVIRRHLSGEIVMGIYTMLKNESTLFLAIDFDKDG